jgi:hypothetical protein
MTNADEVDPTQPFMSLEQFIEACKENAAQFFIRLFRSKSESLNCLMKFFNIEIDGTQI